MPAPGEQHKRRALPPALAAVVVLAAVIAGAVIGNAANSPSRASTTAPAGGSSCNVIEVAERELPSASNRCAVEPQPGLIGFSHRRTVSGTNARAVV